MPKKPSTSVPRTIFAAIFASLIGMILSLIVTMIGAEIYALFATTKDYADFAASLGKSFQELIEYLPFVGLAFIVILPIALLFGIPSHLVLLKTGKWRLWHYLVAGTIMGIPAISVFGGAIPDPNELYPISIVLGMFTGAVAAVIFRLLMGGAPQDPDTATWAPAFAPSPLPAASWSDITAAAIISAAFGAAMALIARLASMLVSGSVPMMVSSMGAAQDPFSDEAWMLVLIKSVAYPLITVFIASIALCFLVHTALKNSDRASLGRYVLWGALGGLLLWTIATWVSGSFIFRASIWTQLDAVSAFGIWASIAGAFALRMFYRRLKIETAPAI